MPNCPPPGLIVALKHATRLAVDALTVAGESGPQRAARLLGVSEGTISKWCRDGYDETVPAWALFWLESLGQRPTFAGALAELTGHRLVPVADEDGGTPKTAALVDGLVKTVGSGAAVAQTLAASLADGRVTPREAQESLAAVGALEADLCGLKRDLAQVAGGEGGR
jgi:hypothetical protein